MFPKKLTGEGSSGIAAKETAFQPKDFFSGHPLGQVTDEKNSSPKKCIGVWSLETTYLCLRANQSVHVPHKLTGEGSSRIAAKQHEGEHPGGGEVVGALGEDAVVVEADPELGFNKKHVSLAGIRTPEKYIYIYIYVLPG